MKHESVLTNEQRRKEDRGASVTVTNFQDAMNQCHRVISGHDEDKEDEIALHSGVNDKQKDKKKQVQ